MNPITHRRTRFIVWTGNWLRVPDAHDGGSYSLRWPWARNESEDRGGAGCKVSCGFTHPIIRALKTTLTIDATEEVLGASRRMDPIESIMDTRVCAQTADHKQYIIDTIYRLQAPLSPRFTRALCEWSTSTACLVNVCQSINRKKRGVFLIFLLVQDRFHFTLFNSNCDSLQELNIYIYI